MWLLHLGFESRAIDFSQLVGLCIEQYFTLFWVTFVRNLNIELYFQTTEDSEQLPALVSE